MYEPRPKTLAEDNHAGLCHGLLEKVLSPNTDTLTRLSTLATLRSALRFADTLRRYMDGEHEAGHIATMQVDPFPVDGPKGPVGFRQ